MVSKPRRSVVICRFSGNELPVAGGRAKRITVCHLVSGLQKEHVVGQRLGISTEPQSETRRHGNLHVGISRHEHILILVALLYKLVEEYLHMLGNVLQLMACEELQVNEHLVVTASSGVYLLSNVALSLRVSMSSTCEWTSSTSGSISNFPSSQIL